MKNRLDQGLYGMAVLNQHESASTNGGEGLLKIVGQLIGTVAAAIVSDIDKLTSGKPVMPAGEKTMYSALG
jgi:hypothetical protein